MVGYNTVNAKLSNTVKKGQRKTLTTNSRMFSANNLPHELLLTTR